MDPREECVTSKRHPPGSFTELCFTAIAVWRKLVQMGTLMLAATMITPSERGKVWC